MVVQCVKQNGIILRKKAAKTQHEEHGSRDKKLTSVRATMWARETHRVIDLDAFVHWAARNKNETSVQFQDMNSNPGSPFWGGKNPLIICLPLVVLKKHCNYKYVDGGLEYLLCMFK